MRTEILSLVAIIIALASVSSAHASIVGRSWIYAPAVILGNNTGNLTNITLTVSTGTGKVNVSGAFEVANNTMLSTQTAARYASSFLGLNFSDYNFSYSFHSPETNVSGPSAGAAMTILAISALENKNIARDFIMTGTVAPDGSIGEVGGIYDKVAAASSIGARFVLVPAVSQYDQENELYYLTQSKFGIPLVQVSNISQAYAYAFSANPGSLKPSSYSLYADYNVGALARAPYACEGPCNSSVFLGMLNETFNLTRNEVSSLSRDPRFSNASGQMALALNQSIATASKGYLYTGADFSFLDYVNAFYFSSYPSSVPQSLALLESVNGTCGSLAPPQLTRGNYEYMINAELRQYWGNYTIGQVISGYNSSQIESDQILDDMYLAAQANGWCKAASITYEKAAQNGTYLAASPLLKNISLSRIKRAAQFGNSIYFDTALLAYNQSNYPVAILDADYAYALSSAASMYNSNASRLDNLSLSIASNSTYGVWASQFANEAYFYVQESRQTGNTTLSKSYSASAYSAALLAQQLSNDTMVISNNLAAAPQSVQTQQIGELSAQIASLKKGLYALEEMIVALFIIDLLIIVGVFISLSKHNRRRRNGRK